MIPRVAIAERRESPASGGQGVGPDRERWVRLAALAVGVALYASLPNRLILGAGWLRWVVPALEVMLIVVLLAGTEHESERRRHLGISLIGVALAGWVLYLLNTGDAKAAFAANAVPGGLAGRADIRDARRPGDFG